MERQDHATELSERILLFFSPTQTFFGQAMRHQRVWNVARKCFEAIIRPNDAVSAVTVAGTCATQHHAPVLLPVGGGVGSDFEIHRQVEQSIQVTEVLCVLAGDGVMPLLSSLEVRQVVERLARTHAFQRFAVLRRSDHAQQTNDADDDDHFDHRKTAVAAG